MHIRKLQHHEENKMNTQEAIEEIVQYWDKYQNDMRPETRNDFLRVFKEKAEALAYAIECMKRLSLPKIDGLEKAIKEDFELRQDCLGQVYWPYSLVLESALEYLKHSER